MAQFMAKQTQDVDYGSLGIFWRTFIYTDVLHAGRILQLND
jgi:hypothetical protein